MEKYPGELKNKNKNSDLKASLTCFVLIDPMLASNGHFALNICLRLVIHSFPQIFTIPSKPQT